MAGGARGFLSVAIAAATAGAFEVRRRVRPAVEPWLPQLELDALASPPLDAQNPSEVNSAAESDAQNPSEEEQEELDAQASPPLDAPNPSEVNSAAESDAQNPSEEEPGAPASPPSDARSSPEATGSLESSEYKPPSYPHYAPDLTELILLAGDADSDVDLSADTLAELGWMKGIKLVDKLVVDHVFRDHAMTFQKGRHCIAAFSGTNDPEDSMESAMGVHGGEMALESRCGFDVNRGIAWEFDGYTSGWEWNNFVKYFRRPECLRVTAIGHSLGGSVATLFAACANSGAYPGLRTDFELITFGAFPISPNPIYSGHPGTPFRGTRYHLSGMSSGLEVAESLPRDSRRFRLDILSFYKKVADTYGLRKFAQRFTTAADQIRLAAPGSVEQTWNDKEMFKMILPVWPTMHEVFTGSGADTTLLSLQPFLRDIMLNITKRGDVDFLFDPVSSWMAAYGYKHALVDYQPVSSRQSGKSIRLQRVPAAQAGDLPRVDPMITLIGSVLAEPKLPNHANCCYYRGDDCYHKYAYAYSRLLKACSVMIYR